MKNYLIYTYSNVEGQINSTKLLGQFSKNKDIFKISYQSNDEGNITLNTLFVSKNQVRLIRKGQVNYSCIFKENTLSQFDILVDNFKIASSLFCHKIEIIENENIFKLAINYDVLSSEKINTQLVIEVKKGEIC